MRSPVVARVNFMYPGDMEEFHEQKRELVHGHRSRAGKLVWQLRDCCGGRAAWSDTMDDLAKYFGAGHAMLQVLTLSGGRLGGPRRICSSSHDDELYLRQFSDAQNPRLADNRFLSRALDQVVDDDDLFEATDTAVLEQWRYKLASAGMGHFMGAMTELGDGSYVGIAFHKSTSARKAFGALQRRDLARMLPDIGQAVAIHNQKGQQAERDVGLRAWANQSHLAVVVCGSEATMIWMNARAEQLINSLIGQQLPAAQAWHSMRAVDLRREAAALYQRGVGSSHIQFNGPYGTVHVTLQVARNEDITFAGVADRQVIVTMSQPEWAPTLVPSALQVLFGLTPAEAMLARDIASGVSLETHAAKRSIAITTARWYLKHTLAKVGVARQQDLVRVLICSSASRVDWAFRSTPEMDPYL